MNGRQPAIQGDEIVITFTSSLTLFQAHQPSNACEIRHPMSTAVKYLVRQSRMSSSWDPTRNTLKYDPIWCSILKNMVYFRGQFSPCELVLHRCLESQKLGA